ncbi:hypothetical protein PGT21_010478 [Puccinia graminis f. sp. tritici]|uniref:Uncharacterized protein n=1 Tax=Puccinia graminis f. sp. tritici TaxID=56615 RepID=A0A5B0MWQ4_PUCGR|nr:hypothetical protein PGT21_010478 [Puccinia graminis f. sp. tritici]KAA1131495.1 hypothetical protein PGTUg99_021533 [Puccinia graminis f. sp. tritici]
MVPSDKTSTGQLLLADLGTRKLPMEVAKAAYYYQWNSSGSNSQSLTIGCIHHYKKALGALSLPHPHHRLGLILSST